jgi:hypothetical protein
MIAPGRKDRQSISILFIYSMKPVSLLVQETHCVHNKSPVQLWDKMKRAESSDKISTKYFATSGLYTYSTVVKAQIEFQAQEKR